MSTRQDRGAGRTLRDEVEEILCLVPGATAAEADALVSLFADAAGPSRSGALPGEAAAVAAFAAARRPPAPLARRARILASLTTLLTVKTAAAALAVTSVGGLALAAGTGTLPTPLASHPHHADRPSGIVDNPTTVVPTPTAAALRDAAKAAVAADRADAKAGKNGSSSYTGLCTAFEAGTWDNARAAGNPAFSRLVTASPGGDVTDFCQALATEATLAGDGAGKGRSAAAPGSKANGHAPGKSAGKGKPAGKGKSAVHRSDAKGKPAAASDNAAGRTNAAAKRGGAG